MLALRAMPPFRVETPGNFPAGGGVAAPTDVFAGAPIRVPLPPSRRITDRFGDPALLKLKGYDRRVPLGAILPTQSGLRRPAEFMDALRADLRRDGRFRETLKLVYFPEDARLFIRDGHHRLSLLLETGRTDLSNEGAAPEYEIAVADYAHYRVAKFVMGADGRLDMAKSWITPFDPRENVRRADFHAFKQLVWRFHLAGVGLADLNRFMHENSALYLDPQEGASPVLEKKEPLESARDWQSYLAAMERSAGPKIAQLLPAVPNSGVFVDVGSGTGDQAYMDALMNPDLLVVGVDVAGQAIEHARKNFGARNLLFLQADACAWFLPDASVSGVTDSSFCHELFSYNGYDRDKIHSYLRNVARALAPGGTYGCRDFSAPHWPDKVRLRVPTAVQECPGPYGNFSRAELFEIYARDFRTADYPDGVTYGRLESGDPEWAVFELDGRAAADFVLRMEYRKNWVAELKEQYLYFDLDERVRAAQAAGLRVDYAGEVHNTWIYLNWWKNRLGVSDVQGNPIDLPPTNALLYAVKPGPNDPRELIVKEADGSRFPRMNVSSWREREGAGRVFELVHVPDPTRFEVPFERSSDGRIFLYARRRAEIPALAHYAGATKIYHVHYSGYSAAGFGVADDVGSDAWKNLAAQGFAVTSGDLAAPPQEAPPYFPVPGISDEIVAPRFVELRSGERPVGGDGRAQRIELKQIVASAHVGAIPDARLEVAAYALARRYGAPLLPWFDGTLPVQEQDVAHLRTAASYASWIAPGTACAFEPSPARSDFAEILNWDVTRVAHDGRETSYGAESLVPKKHSVDTFSVVPYVRAKGEVLVGLETRVLPAFAARGFAESVAVTPAWRIPKDIDSRNGAVAFLKEKMADDFGLYSRHVTPLGEGYFPAPEHTPEKVTPFAVEIDAARAPRDLVFVSLETLLREIDEIPDLHTRVSLYRLAHALNLSGGAIR